MTPLLALVRRPARSGGAPPSATLRGRGAEWQATERALLPEVTASDRRGARLVAAFSRLAAASREDEARGRAARLAGSFHTRHGRFAESVKAYRVAVARLGGMARDGARLGLAASLARVGRFDAAADLCRTVRRGARRRGEGGLAAAAALNLGVALHEGGNPAGALDAYAKARTEFGAAGLGAHAAMAAQNRANALVLLDRYEEAAPLYASAADELAEAGAAREAARCRYNRGALLVAQERLGAADAELRGAEADLRRAGAPALASLARLDRAEALLRARLLPEARHAVQTARRGMGAATPPAERARGVLLAARIELARGDAASARRLLGRALPQETPALHAERLALRGRASAAQGRTTEARRLLEAAAAEHGRTRPAARSRALAAAAWCALAQGDVVTARRLARSAGRQGERLGVPGLVHGAAAVRFLVEDAAGRRSAASAALAEALAALEDVRAGLGPEQMRRAVLRGSEGWFARAVRHVLESDGPEAALALVERWRARSLVDLLGAADRIDEDDERIAALRARVARLERRLESDDVPAFLRGPQAPTAVSISALHRAERALAEASIGDAAPAFAPELDLDRLRRSVPADTLVLSLFGDGSGGVAFHAGDDVRAVTGLGSRPHVASLVEELSFQIGRFALGPEVVARHRRRLEATTSRLLGELSAVTLAPVAHLLERARRVVIVPDGPWHAVPFAALPVDGKPLAARVPISLAPTLAALATDVRQARGRSVVIAAPDAQAPRIADEGRAVARALGDARLLTGDAARADELGWRTPPRCLHIAAHGRFRSDAPSMSGVRLADGWLRAIDFRRLALDGSLVVLSGCNTGAAHVDAGGEIEGLVRGVLASGASDLVVSLWRVDDAATTSLMRRFHTLRARGMTPDAALAMAQAERARRGIHPWYWAGFGCWSRRLRAAGR